MTHLHDPQTAARCDDLDEIARLEQRCAALDQQRREAEARADAAETRAGDLEATLDRAMDRITELELAAVNANRGPLASDRIKAIIGNADLDNDEALEQIEMAVR